MSPYVIGVDIGTGSTKALAVDVAGNVIQTAQVHYPTSTPAPGYYEQAPEIIWQAFIQSINKTISEMGSAPDAIILSSAMHSLIPVDQVGTALHNMIIWADNRSAAFAEKLQNAAVGKLIYEQTGTPIHAMTPLCKLMWLKENDPVLFNKTSKFISIKEYVWYRLFHCFEVDHSIASATGLMDIETSAWNNNALDVAGISAEKLSILVSTNYHRSDVVPGISTLLLTSPSTTFVIGASDGCLANLGSFAIKPGVAALTIGTSGAVRVASKIASPHFKSMIFSYRLDEDTFICGGPSNNGGAALKWYVESFMNKPLTTTADYDAVLKSMSDTPAGADGLIFLPYVFGERAPIWNSEACGVFFGLKSTHTQEHFTRAVIEGISMALYDITDHMITNGLAIKQIHVSGGFVRSSVWLQTIANIFNKKICLINSDDASALGAAFLGLKALGLISSYDVITPGTVREINPQPECILLYEAHFKRFRALYESLRGHMVSQND
jgi:gluconokinase